MKHTRGIDVSRTGIVAAALTQANDLAAWRVYGGIVVARAAAYEAADRAYEAAFAVAETGEAQDDATRTRIEALRKATRDHDTAMITLAEVYAAPVSA